MKARTTSVIGRAAASDLAARARGFTLLEVILVVVILMIASALAVPSFIRSFRGAKLRSAARAIVMSHRYARAMAVLKQTDAAILYDARVGEIEVVSVKSPAEADRNKFLDNRSGEVRRGAAKTDSGSETIVSELRRRIPDGVRIDRVVSRTTKQEREGLFWVRYYSNGMCDDYHVRLTDEHQKRAVVKVDPISGKVAVEYE